MIKVKILTRCTHCNGAAHQPCGEEEDYKGESYTLHRPCPQCQGSGNQGQYIGLVELGILLQDAQCPHEHTSYNGGMHFTAGDVWDDIEEVCDDCGVKLISQ